MATPTSNQRAFATGPEFVPLSYCLLDAAEVVSAVGQQKLGVMYQVDSCSTPLEYSAACVTGGAPKEPNMDVVWRAADPFIVYSWLPCTYAGGEPPEKLREDTLAAHKNNLNKRVDEVFWTGGDENVSQHLSSDSEVVVTSGGSDVILQTAATVVSGGAVLTLEAGISQLTTAMSGCYGGTPWIHVPYGVIDLLAAAHLLRDDLDSKGRLRLKSGAVVVGYSSTNTGPDGTPAPSGQAWIYATGPVKVWQGEPIFTARDAKQALVRDTNATVLIVEQRFLIGWDCCHFAARVSTI